MPRFFAHRGSSAAYPENTRAAYLQAIADGADGIETDVHVSADGVLVCHHDAVLGRTEDATGEVRALTLAQLRALDVTSWKGVPIPPELGGPERAFCTFEELGRIAQGAGRPIEIAVETKHQLGDDPRVEAALVADLERLGMDASRRIGDVTLSFMSFQPEAVLRLVDAFGPDGVCQLIEDKRRGWEATVLNTGAGAEGQDAYARIFPAAARNLHRGVCALAGPGVETVRAHQDVARGWFERMAGRVWTVDSVEDAQFLLGLGVQQLTSNDPAALRAGLEAAHVG